MRVCTLLLGQKILSSLSDLCAYVCVRVCYTLGRAAGPFVQVGCSRCLTTTSAAGPKRITSVDELLIANIHTVWL